MNDFTLAKTIDAINDLLKPLLADGILTDDEALLILDTLEGADLRHAEAAKAAR